MQREKKGKKREGGERWEVKKQRQKERKKKLNYSKHLNTNDHKLGLFQECKVIITHKTLSRWFIILTRKSKDHIIIWIGTKHNLIEYKIFSWLKLGIFLSWFDKVCILKLILSHLPRTLETFNLKIGVCQVSLCL